MRGAHERHAGRRPHRDLVLRSTSDGLSCPSHALVGQLGAQGELRGGNARRAQMHRQPALARDEARGRGAQGAKPYKLRARLLHPALPMTHLCYRCTAPATATDGADARQRVPLVSN